MPLTLAHLRRGICILSLSIYCVFHPCLIPSLPDFPQVSYHSSKPPFSTNLLSVFLACLCPVIMTFQFSSDFLNPSVSLRPCSWFSSTSEWLRCSSVSSASHVLVILTYWCSQSLVWVPSSLLLWELTCLGYWAESCYIYVMLLPSETQCAWMLEQHTGTCSLTDSEPSQLLGFQSWRSSSSGKLVLLFCPLTQWI